MKNLPRLIFIFWTILFLAAFLFAAGDGKLHVYYINVGGPGTADPHQGDAEYIVFPDGSNMLIDGGPTTTADTSNPLLAFLSDAKIGVKYGGKNLDRMMLSHGHSDHYGGLLAVYNSGITVNTYYDSFLAGSGGAQTLRSIAQNKSSCINTTSFPNDGSILFSIINSTPPVYVYLLHNGTAFYPGYLSENDLSLVIKIVFGQSRFLFGGDAGAGGSYMPLEGWLVNIYGNNLQADMYKVHHHGSSTSSSSNFLSYLKPRYAFIETGLGNPYGHPTSDALSRIAGAIANYHPEYSNGYANIYRTDLNGTIEVIADGTTNYTVIPNVYVEPTEITKPGSSDISQPLVGSAGTSYIISQNNFFNPDRINAPDTIRNEPFSISYFTSNSGNVSLRIFTLSGRPVYSYSSYVNSGGNYLYWNGKTDSGETVPPGVYVAYIETPTMKTTKKIVIIR